MRKALERFGFSFRSSRSDDGDDGEHIVWDVLDPFAPPDPTQHRLRALLEAEVARMRRYESIGPLQPLPDADTDSDEPYSDTDSDEAYNDTDSDWDSREPKPADDADADDEEDADGDDGDDDKDEDERADARPLTIAPPRLLHTRPLCFIPSSPPPPPSPAPSSSSSGEGPSAPWLAHSCIDIAEAEERARKARRDAHRSRLKALAILGPEAAAAI